MHKDRFATRNDEIYPALEHFEGDLSKELPSLANQSEGPPLNADMRAQSGFVEGVDPIKVDADENRKPRSLEEMIQEAEWLKTFFSSESV